MSSKENTLLIPAIKDGSVIDHIPVGLGIKVIRLLKLEKPTFTVTLAMRLHSKRLGFKDLVKIESLALSEEQAHIIALFAPHGTINVVENFTIKQKMKAILPSSIKAILICPNTSCITHHEPCTSHFFVKEHKHNIHLTCKYCQKAFVRDELKDYAS